MIADRQIHTHTDMLITILRSPIGGGVMIRHADMLPEPIFSTILTQNIKHGTFFKKTREKRKKISSIYN